MRILWFTNTPSNAAMEFGEKNFGGGWISSLETLIVDRKDCELSICFLYKGESLKKIAKGNVTYYGIPLKKSNVIQRLISRHLAQFEDKICKKDIAEVISSVKPDLIHVFGTENSFGKLLMNYPVKVLFHLQGLIGPYYKAYFPNGINKHVILNKSSWRNILLGKTFYDNYNYFGKMAKREIYTIKHWKYYSGRTEWDRNYIHLLNPNAQYFHCDELLRSEFYNYKWVSPSNISKNNTITIGTTISASLYKGLDLIYKVLELVKGRNIIWKVFGISEGDVLNKIIKDALNLNNKEQKIKFYGPLSPTDLIEQLKTCHFFVHPSYIDNSPNSVCEAMLLGMPVLSSSVGGVKSLINNTETGFLFNPYDEFDLAGQLVYLIDNYEIAKNAGSIARQRAYCRHSPDTIYSDLLKIYNYILLNDSQ
jgi:glycosyltransferase involved in cell wall biosynthesis